MTRRATQLSPARKKSLSSVELRDLTCLIRLAEAGSSVRAAAELGIETSTVSRRVAHIEAELGVLLFERSHAGVRLTPVGRDVLRLVRRALGDLDAIRSLVSRTGRAVTGELRLATQISTLGPRLRAALRGWRLLHPLVRIELTEANDREVLSALRDRRADIAILFSPTVTPRIASHELWYERLLLAVPSRHPLATLASVGWQHVRKEALLVRGWETSQAYREVQAGLIGSGADFRTHYAGSLDLLNLVAIGEGAMIVLESHREIAIRDVVYLDIDQPNACVSVAIAWTPDLEDPVAGSFVAFMRDRVGSEDYER